MDVNRTSYAPSDLAIQTGKKITLPKDATFADAGIKSRRSSGRSAGGTVGVLNYIYNERKIGSAYLMTKAGAEALAAAEAAGGRDHWQRKKRPRRAQTLRIRQQMTRALRLRRRPWARQM